MSPETAPKALPRTRRGTWQEQLRDAIRDPDRLIDRLRLPEELRPGARRAAELFPLVVPHAFVDRMRPGDPTDPLLRQVLPLHEETATPPGFSPDPLGEAQAQRAAGLLQKYSGRALLITTGVCAVGCRYCFRRHFPYTEDSARLDDGGAALAAIAADPSIEEAILSGGDPLLRTDHWLEEFLGQLESIPHLRRLRIHTRLPIVIPDRVTDRLLARLAGGRLAPTLVVHANHPDEIDATCGAALLRSVRAGIPTLNQSVLLRGVNDDAEAKALTELSQKLLDVRVQPYYLHQLDPVQGAAHFAVSVERGRELIATLRQRLPGFGVPRFVREECGAAHKLDL